MSHGISEGQWLEYVDGSLDTAQRRVIEDHLSECAECARLCSELRAWHQAIQQEAARLREACLLPEDQLDLLLSRSLVNLHAAEPAALRRGLEWTVREAMFLLRSLTESFGGPGTARATIDLAVLRSTAHRGEITGTDWKLFVSNLSEAIDSVCGSAAGRLVGKAGACLLIEDAR